MRAFNRERLPVESTLSIVVRFRQELDRRFLLKIVASPIGCFLPLFDVDVESSLLMPSHDELTIRIDFGCEVQLDRNVDKSSPVRDPELEDRRIRSTMD